MTDALPLIVVRDLAYDAPDGRRLVAGLSYDLMPGGIVAITGPNGTGKSSLLKILAGLEKADDGALQLQQAGCLRDVALRAGKGLLNQVALDVNQVLFERNAIGWQGLDALGQQDDFFDRVHFVVGSRQGHGHKGWPGH